MFGSRFIPSLESLGERANPGGSWGSVGGADPFLVGGPGNVPEDDEVGLLGTSKPGVSGGSGLFGVWVGPIGDPGEDGNDAGGGRGGIGGEF
jgi:hypothetical protein